MPEARVAIEAGTYSIWISEQLEELGHEMIVANVREPFCTVTARAPRSTPKILLGTHGWIPRSFVLIAHRSIEQQQALTLIRAWNVQVRLRTAAVNAVRGLTKCANLIL